MEHHLDGVEVGDDSVFEGAHGDDALGRLADHRLRFGAHAEGATGAGVNGDDARLGDDNALAAHVDEGVGGSEVDTKIATEHPEEPGKGAEQPGAPLNA